MKRDLKNILASTAILPKVYILNPFFNTPKLYAPVHNNIQRIIY
jgi:hypothetical protein